MINQLVEFFDLEAKVHGGSGGGWVDDVPGLGGSMDSLPVMAPARSSGDPG